MTKSTMGVKLDEETRERLQSLGKRRDRSSHWLMSEAIKRYLDVEERCESEKEEDEARWQRYVETGIAISHTEISDKLDAMVAQAKNADKP